MYKLIAQEIERLHTYNNMIKSFPPIYMNNITPSKIIQLCKSAENLSVDPIIPNWNDKAVEFKLFESITKNAPGVIYKRLLNNLRERLNKFLRIIDNMDMPAITPSVYFDAIDKLYIIKFGYSYMTIEQKVSQRVYSTIQKEVGNNKNIILIVFWLYLRYSNLHANWTTQTEAILTKNPKFDDMEKKLISLKSQRKSIPKEVYRSV